MKANAEYWKLAFVLFFAVSSSSMAADERTGKDAGASAKVAYQPATETLNAGQKSSVLPELVFSAAPRGTPEASEQMYAPLAEYLSKAIGKKIVYKYPGSWGVYQGNMQKGVYDLVYDGPHFNGWRVAKLEHNVLVKIPHELVFVAVVKKDSAITNVKQLAGRTVCAHAPPNFGTLTLLSQFDNPARQPVIVNIDGWDNIYKGMTAGQCVAAVIPKKALDKNDKDGTTSKVIYKSKSLPNQAISAGRRITKEDQAKLAQALVSPDAAAVTEKIRQEYGAASLVPAVREEYIGMGEFLKNEWGYYN